MYDALLHQAIYHYDEATFGGFTGKTERKGGGEEKTAVFRRAVDPHSLYADPDPAVFLNADPDPGPGPA